MTRGRAVLLGLAGALCILASTSMPWLDARALDTTGGGLEVLSGARVHPSSSGIGLVVAAAAVALSLVDGVVRRIVAVVLTLGGLAAIGLTISTVVTRAVPAAAAGSTGWSADGAVHLGGPAFAAIGGVAAAASGLAALRGGQHWGARPARQRRDEKVGAPATDWDRLSAGDDPTG